MNNKFYTFLFVICCFSRYAYAQCTGISLADTIKICTGTTAIIPASISVAAGDSVIDTGWTPVAGLSDTNSLTPTVTLSSGSAYYKLHLTTLTGANLVVNGNFSSGNTGFTSSYTYSPPPSSLLYEGFYSVTTDPYIVHIYFDSFKDHTSGSGNMLVVNGGASAVDIWCQTIPVIPNTYYAFSAWFANCSFLDTPGYFPIFQFRINGSLLGSVDTLKSARKLWTRYYTTWYSGSNTTASICIYDALTAAIGNDFAIDDISFRKFCNSYDSVLVKIDTIHVAAGPDTGICNGSVTLRATGASSYVWAPSTGLSCTACPAPVASPTTTTTYIVTGTSGGCTGTDTVTVTVGNITVHASGPPKICHGETANITATGASRYLWSPKTGLSCDSCANPIVDIDASTQYVVTGYDTGNCSGKDSITIHVLPLPEIAAGSDPNVVCSDHAIKLIAAGGTTYIWSPGVFLNDSTSSNPTVKGIDRPVSFYVTGTDSNGCKSSDTIMVQPLKDAIVDMPSAFSPNGDGVNDVFYVRGANVASMDCVVYSRWGQKVFETNDIIKGWDGSYNGAKLPMEAYACVIKVRTMDGCEIIKKGSLTLLR